MLKVITFKMEETDIAALNARAEAGGQNLSDLLREQLSMIVSRSVSARVREIAEQNGEATEIVSERLMARALGDRQARIIARGIDDGDLRVERDGAPVLGAGLIEIYTRSRLADEMARKPVEAKPGDPNWMPSDSEAEWE